jgi:periplasmic protein TonB
MKNFLLVVLLMFSSVCWAQTCTPQYTKSGSIFYTYAEQMPQFPGGNPALLNFIDKNLQYPAEAKQNEIKGTVYATFIIFGDGSISDITITKDIGDGCGDAVIRLIKSMPKWIPGKQNGNIVNVKYQLPVSFHPSVN